MKQLLGLALGLLLFSAAAFAGSPAGFPQASVPLGNSPDAMWIDQGAGCPSNVAPCTSSQVSSLRVGQPIQTNCAAVATPFQYQECIDTSASPPLLKQYLGTVWWVIATLDPVNGWQLTPVGKVSISNATASTSPTTGALTVVGGVGIGGALNIGGAFSAVGSISGAAITGSGPLTTTNATASTSTSTGSGIFGGGIGVAGNGYFGGHVFDSGNQVASIAGSGLALSAGTVSCPAFTSVAVGCVPASGGGTANFLNAAGSFTSPLGAVVNKSASYVVLSTDSGTIFTNSGAGAEVDFTLPAASPALTYCFIAVSTGQVLKVVAPASVTILAGLNSSSSGGNLTTSNPYSTLCIVAISTTQWVARSIEGLWNYN